jgi:alpha 1,3-mannosyltransferase
MTVIIPGVNRRIFQVLVISLFIGFQIFFFTRSSARSAVVIAPDRAGGIFAKLIETAGDGIETLSYSDRCELFFKSLYTENEVWRTFDFSGLPYHQQIFETKDSFINDKIKNYKKELKDVPDNQKDKVVDEKGMRKVFELEYEKAIEDTRTTETYIVDAATALRVYGACYLDQYGKYNTETSTAVHCSEIENRMFQWASRAQPKYTRWDGQTMNQVPIISDYVDQGMTHVRKRPTGCFLRDFRESLNGKGFVISAKDAHLKQLLSLIALLRVTGNDLPVQVSHFGDLSLKAQKVLIHAARTLELDLTMIDSLSTGLVSKNIDKDVESLTKEELAILYPPLELWFLDVSGAVSKRYEGKFTGFANKLLAYFFCSFQETILLDTDTAPMADFDKNILQSSEFRELGAFFFKDRELMFQKKMSDVTFFKKLMPSSIDELLFSIPRITEKTLNNRYIGYQFYHFMESGVVAIDKHRHFTGVLATLLLQIWSPVGAKVWGDKELFWLGMSLAGDEDYHMNYWAAGAVGQITPRDRRLVEDKTDERRKKLTSNQICSTHPSHLSGMDNTTLLWFNAGIQFCKNIDSFKGDFDRTLLGPFFETSEDLHKFYKGYTKVEAIIIPKGEETYVANDFGETPRGWSHPPECGGYMFCAYDKIGGCDDAGTNGKLVEFNETQRNLYNFYGSSGEYYIQLLDIDRFMTKNKIKLNNIELSRDRK